MAYASGETITEYLNTGEAADVWTVLSAIRPSGTFTPTITEVSPGVYKIDIVTTEAGAWFLSIEGAASGQYDSTYDVDAATPVTGLTPTTVVGGASLGDLRRRLGDRLGDMIIATATSDGTLGVFYDVENLRRADNAYRGWNLYVASATVAGNIGESRYIQGSTQSAGAVTIQPELSAGIFTAGDIIELHGNAGIGWNVREKNSAINEAISQAATMGGIEAVASSVDLFDRDGPLLDVPTQLRFVHAVEWLDTDGQGRMIPYAKGRGKSGWWANRATGQIEISGDYRESADGATVRFWGHGDHVPLVDDTDVTLVNPTWIIAAAVYYLSLGYGQDRNPDKMRSLIADARQEMSIWRRAATRVRPANSVSVRGY